MASTPNVLWILGDQHRGQALGYMGDPNIATPTLDRLACGGLVSTGAVAGFPLCCAFRGSMLTGRYPHHCVPGHERPLPADQPTIAHVLNDAGYHTAYFGKWHLDGYHERNGRAAMHITDPSRRGGFQSWLGVENNNSPWDCWVHGDQRGEQVHYRLPGYETDALTDLAVEYLAERRRLQASGDDPRPFFCVLSVQPPHDPYAAPAEWMVRHTPGTVRFRPNVPDVPRIREQASREIAGYAAQVENLDWNIGRLYDALAAQGLLEDTHMLFFSDHGDMLGSHGQFRKMSPWQESINIPFLIAGGPPNYRHRAGRVDLPINHVDIAPTTLGLCGVPVPASMVGYDYSARRIVGRDLGEEPDSAYLQSVIPTRHGNSVDRPWRGVTTRDGWKYVCLEGQPWLMFNLREDPYEQVNVAHNTQFAVERRRLHDRLAAWVADTGDTFALPEL